MKKKFLSLLLSLFLMMPCAAIMTGCGNDAKLKFQAYSDEGINCIYVYSASASEDDSDSADVDSANQVGSYNFNGRSSNVKVTKESYVIITLQLATSYMHDINDFKILKNGEELTHISLAMFDNSSLQGDYLYDLGVVNEDVEITFQGHAKIKEFTFTPNVLNYSNYENDNRCRDLRFQLLLNNVPLEYNSKTEFTANEVVAAFTSKAFIYGTDVKMKVYYVNRDKLFTHSLMSTFTGNGNVVVNENLEMVYDFGIAQNSQIVTIDFDLFEEVTLEDLTNIKLATLNINHNLMSLFEEGNYTFILTINGSEVETATPTHSQMINATNTKIKFTTTTLTRILLLDEYTTISNQNIWDLNTTAQTISKDKV